MERKAVYEQEIVDCRPPESQHIIIIPSCQENKQMKISEIVTLCTINFTCNYIHRLYMRLEILPRYKDYQDNIYYMP